MRKTKKEIHTVEVDERQVIIKNRQLGMGSLIFVPKKTKKTKI